MCQIRDPRFAFFRETAKDSPRIVHSTVSSRYSTSASNVASPLRNSNSTAGHTPKATEASPPSKRSSPTKKATAQSAEVIRVFDVEAEEDRGERRPAYAQFSVQLDNGKRAWLPREELPVSARLPLKRMINVLRLKLRVSEEEYARLGRIEESGSEVEDEDSEDELEMENDSEDDDDGKGKKKAAVPKYTIKNVTLYGESRKDAGSSSPSVRSPRKTQISWEDYLKKELPQVRSEADEDAVEESEDASDEGVELEMESVHEEESDDGSHAGTEDTSESESDEDGSSSSDLAEAAEVIYQTQMMHSSPKSAVSSPAKSSPAKSSPLKSSPAKSPLPLSIQASPAKSALPVCLSADVPSKRSSTGGESAEDRAKRVAERMATARKSVDKKPSAGCPVM